MKILFLTPSLPLGDLSGGVVKTAKMLAHLACSHDVTLGFLFDEGAAEVEKAQIVREFGLNECFSASVDRSRSLWNYLRSFQRGLPFPVARNTSDQFADQVRIRILSDKFDLVFVDHFLMYQYVQACSTVRLVVHQHNAEHVLWRRFASMAPIVLSPLILLEALRVSSFERAMCLMADAVLASPNDLDALQKLGVSSEKFHTTLHLGDESLLGEDPIDYADTCCRVISIGRLDWPPNDDGLRWFVAKSWPKVLETVPNAELVIIGAGASAKLTELVSKTPNARLLGYIDELGPFYSTSRVHVSPLRSGSGIKVKVVNAACRGLPQVGTKIAIEGTGMEKNSHVLVGDTAVEFADAVVELLTDPIRWLEIRDASRGFADTNFRWSSVLERLDRAISG